MKHIKHWLATMAVLLCSITTNAQTKFEIDGIWYYINTYEYPERAVVTHQGDGEEGYFDGYSGSITIPSTVTYRGMSYSVMSIGRCAFSICPNLISVTIPASVTNIGYFAFEGSNLTTVNIPENSQLEIISGYAFSSCSSLSSITLPESLMNIAENAFAGCSKLTSINIPEKVTWIGDWAFTGCSKLTSINIPEDSQLESIGTYAFENCSKLTSITIPESVTWISDGAFSGCSGIASIAVAEGNTMYDSRGECNAIIETSSNTLIIGCSSTVIPESVTSIGNEAFLNCRSLTSVNIPERVTSIGNYAFQYCDSLTSITIPESVTSIGVSAFFGCRSLTDIYCYAENVPSTASNTFSSSPVGNATLHVPASALEAYSTTAPWSGFGNIVALASDDVAEEDSYELLDGRVYMVNGEIYEIDSTDDGISPEAPEKEGYTFAEWKLADDEKITEIDIKNNADAMLYSNAPCITDAYGDQFVGWHVLFDGDAGTFFHSDYSGVDSEDGLDHYLRVDMGEGKRIKKFTFTYTVRGDNTPYYTPKRIVVEGSNEANGEYTEITVLTNLPKIGGRVYESGVLGNGNAYRYIRYRVTETDYNNKVQGHPYFYFAEFGMEKVQEVYHAVYTPNPVSDITLTINQYGSGTYCSEYALDFSEVEGLKAYVAAGYDSETGVVTLLRVMTANAGVGLFVKGEPGDYVVPTLESTSYNALNMLVGTLEETTVNSTDGSYTNYKYTIREGDAEPKFYPFADASTQAAGRAYLQIPTAWLPAAEQKSISIRFDEGEGTTDIENTEFTIQNSALIYDLMGSRVANPTKGGIYIVNGKKTVF